MPKPRAVAVAIPVYLPASPSLVQAPNSLHIPPDLVTNEQPLFLLCSSRKHADRYVLPKGGIEKGETAEEAALREGWEEAGFRGRAVVSLGEPVPDRRSAKAGRSAEEVPRAIYHFTLVLVDKLEDKWPEDQERTRTWATRDEAERLTSWREEVAEGLARLPTTLAGIRALCQVPSSQ